MSCVEKFCIYVEFFNEAMCEVIIPWLWEDPSKADSIYRFVKELRCICKMWRQFLQGCDS